jgi:adenine-specific DNA-methyltransferase
LVGAYTFLLDYYLSYYTEPLNLKKALKRGVIYESGYQSYRLSIDEKQRLLLNSIYGVDIDPIAVEVTKLSLYLKLLEHETEESHPALFSNKYLPDLDANIRCGNSLVGSDFYIGKQMSLFDDNALRKVNAFDWQKEFPHIFRKHGGFDCVVSNPPYVRIQLLNQSAPDNVEYYNQKYSECIAKSYDIYVIFLYRGFQLLKPNGRQGVILPHKFFQAEMGEKIRSFLSQKHAVSKIVDFSTNQVFSNAATYTCLLFLDKAGTKTWKHKRFQLGEDITELGNLKFETRKTSELNVPKWTFADRKANSILQKIYDQPDSFSGITEKIFKGSSTGNDDVFLLDLQKPGKKTSVFFSRITGKNVTLENDLLVPFLYGEDIRRYAKPETSKYLLFPYKEGDKGDNGIELIGYTDMSQKYPLCFEYFTSNRKVLMKRKIKLSSKDFYRYSAARSLNEYLKQKIMIPDMLVSLRVSCDFEGKFFHGPAIHSVVFKQLLAGVNEKFYLAILNSKLFWFFISHTSTALRGNAYRLTPEFVSPFCFPSPLNKKEIPSKSHDRLVDLANQMLAAQIKLRNAVSDSDRRLHEQRILILDREIDTIVFQLYGLTAEEIAIIENDDKV